MNPNFNHLRQHAYVRTALITHVIAGVLGISLCSTTARAAEESRSADIAAARELAIEGLKLADAGQCNSAIDRLSRAEKLYHSPIVLGRLGECEIAVGRIVDGTEDLRKLLREPVSGSATPALTKALERAQASLELAKGRIALLKISVKEPTTDVTVTVDGQLVPPALFDRGRPTDPGEHNVEATAAGYLKASRAVTLAPGEKQDLTFTLVAADESPTNGKAEPGAAGANRALLKQQPAPATGSTSSDSSLAAAEKPAKGRSYAPSYAIWSVGAGSATVGGVFGYLALKGKKDLDKSCSNDLCPSSSQSALDSAKRDATVSTVLLATGGGLLAVGTFVYLLTATSSEKPPATASASVEPMLGFGQVGVQGLF